MKQLSTAPLKSTNRGQTWQRPCIGDRTRHVKNQVEKTPLFALKRFLGVSQKTPNSMIYGDTARYPLYINVYVRTVRYWLKITTMCETRLPYAAYLMLLHLDEQGKINWVTKVRLALFRSGFGYVWQNKRVQAINMFMG